ncbi:MAG: hypothetical protein VB980_07150, partial [Opitutales bacterium]
MRKTFFNILSGMLRIVGFAYGQATHPNKDTAALIKEVDDLLKSLGDDFNDAQDGTIPVEPPANVTPPVQERGENLRADQILMPAALHEAPKKPAPAQASPKASSGLAIGAMTTSLSDAFTTEELESMTYEQQLNLGYVDFMDDSPIASGVDPIRSGRSGAPIIPVPNPSSLPAKVIPLPDSDFDSDSPLSRPTQVHAPVARNPLVGVSPENDPGAQPTAEPKDYFVFDGHRIDDDLSQLIREAIQETRMSHAGTNYPSPSASIKKAESKCNKVLYRLSKPEHKQYRRDVLLALIRMFENSKMLVEAAKSTERFLEEFANDPKYPFENGEDSPTIAQMHIHLGKIYRQMGAFRLAINKFYDGLNATLIVPKTNAFAFKYLADDAMLEIAETYLEMEEYANAIKFFSRLLHAKEIDLKDVARDLKQSVLEGKISEEDARRSLRTLQENLNKTEEGHVRFQLAYAHYQRAAANRSRDDQLKLQQAVNKTDNAEDVRIEYAPGTSPKYDWDRVELSLRDFAFEYPKSHYLPESHYLLALTYQQQNKDEQAIQQVKTLLTSLPYRPDRI